MTATYIPSGYPFPDTKSNITDAQADMTEARLVWRKSLPDFVVRSMAVDYRMGKHTEDNYDAYLEYEERLKGADELARAKKPSPKRKNRKSRR